MGNFHSKARAASRALEKVEAEQDAAVKAGGTADPRALSRLFAKHGKSVMWAIFLPKNLHSDGAKELLAIVFFHAYRVWQNLKLTRLVREGDRVIFNRNRGHYMSNQRAMFWLSLQLYSVSNASKYVRSLLALNWKEKITRVLHGKYFDRANYYHVEQTIKDADIRMTDEAWKVADGFAEFLDAGLYNVCTGVFYLSKIWAEYGAVYAFAPGLYIFGANVLARKLAPLNYSLFGKLSQAKAAYRGAQTRLVVHAEAVAALRGAEREACILDGLFQTMAAAQRKVFSNLFPHSVAVEALVYRLMWTGVGWFVIGRGVWDPPTDGSIAAIAEVRAEVGYQFVLYLQVVSAASEGSSAVTEYGKLQGEAGRLLELMHALDRVGAAQERQGEASFKAGNAIAFEGVDVLTPTGHLLVQDLSFIVTDQNDSLLLTGHNGAGKSSIFRCLAGLWAVPTGMVTKPGDFRDAVFYIPQRACEFMLAFR